MSRTITRDALEVGDIIVTTTNAAISRAIRTATGSSVSHSMLYVGNGEVIEAVGGGVRRASLETAFTGAILAVALRRDTLNESAARAVVSYAEEQVGRSYDTTGILGQAGYQLDLWFLCRVQGVQDCETRAARANLWMQSDDSFFCSELIAAAFQHVGLPLTDTRAAAVSPQTLVDVTSTNKLLYVGHLLGDTQVVEAAQ